MELFNAKSNAKTLSGFFENCSNPELFKKVWEQGGVSFITIKECPYDYYAPNTGAVPGMIYYKDTCRFARKNVWLILEQLSEYENEIGEPLEKPSDIVHFQNWLSWFAWENMMNELIRYLED